MLSIEGLTIRSKAKTIVNQLELAVHPGEWFALAGESGSGKSTLARCILTLEPSDQGELVIDGQSVRGLRHGKLKRLRSRLGAVFQHPAAALNARLTILQSLLEPLNQLKAISLPI